MEGGCKGARPREEGDSPSPRLTTFCCPSVEDKFTSPLVFAALWTSLSIYFSGVKKAAGVKRGRG